ncbi:nucleotide exchange factor GrpE [Polynucleobacter sp. MWH-CaK5]|uniref:nucleotide exchange factor GrpE n=1 Tax=Polynucleobacter sp. MWH-CaK5 TaxID=2689107 RepID=UPI001BFD042E|nr:nucleotide exchange factor GrpE [Polynucleobacter sp. MWH-CaK5]QWD88649.1 nucleotide exchange factor GrpE [Polynucleobacter sp. MWH-CaK5]
MSQDKNQEAPSTSQENTHEINELNQAAKESDVSGAADAAKAPLTPEETILALEAQIKEFQDQFLRAKAEVENARRRSMEDVAKAHKFAIEGFAENLLPVLDSLNAALTDSGADSAKMKEGIELTLKQLVSALEKGRVLEINPVGEKFDPHRHQAIAMVPHEQEANTVVTVLQKGYLIADRVLRPALVTVSQPK